MNILRSQKIRQAHLDGKYPPPWNKGKNKKDDKRIYKYSIEKKTGKFKNCIICNKEYWAIPSQEDRRKFCSYKCYNEYVSEYCTGENSHSWKGGKVKQNVLRTTRDYKKWRKSVFERDHFTCAMCSAIGGSLEAHHILPRRYYPNLWKKVDNGITLCIDCHHSIKGKELKYVYTFKRWTAGRCLSI